MSTLIADLLVPFAEMGSIRLRDASGTLRKRIIVSLHFADAVRVHDTLFPSEHIDWPAVRDYLSETHVATPEWVRLVALLHFINEPNTRAAVTELLTAAAAGTRVTTHGRDLNPIESLQLCFARAGVAPTWDTLCKTFVLSNLADIDVGVALTHLLSESPSALLLPLAASAAGSASASSASVSAQPNSNKNKQYNINHNNTNAASAASVALVVDTVVKHLPSCRHSQEDYSRTFAQLLHTDACHVATHLIVRAIRSREEQQEQARQKALDVLRSTKKPSLTRLLEEKEANSSSSETAAARLMMQSMSMSMSMSSSSSSSSSTAAAAGNDDSFKRFCHRARFAGNMSPRIRTVCYFVAALQSLSAEAKADAFRAILGQDASPAMLHALTHIVLLSPEAGVLRAFVTTATHTGAPCDALKRFKQECVPSSAGRGGTLVMHWTTVLRLYLAAYCRPPLNKDLWGYVLSSAAAAASSSAAAGGSTGSSSGSGNSSSSCSHGETDAAVQAFVRSNALAMADIVELLLADY